MTREGIRATTPARSIVEAASAGTAPEQIEVAILQALDEGLATRRALLAQLGRRKGGRVDQLVLGTIDESERLGGISCPGASPPGVSNGSRRRPLSQISH